ncbi:hypothetical protein Dsin_019729 [Dipteronia sinensis]|uniref:Glycine-rich protein n=1 Tax=Dipteronia sinensis TaxID=43782 RepID=A0AAE0A959_9ROSI|nr:hypothetical protein Dsin_019729 [Dipteronia sinensis]
MGFSKLGFSFLLLLFQLHLLPAFPISLKNLLLTDFDLQQNVRYEGMKGMQERSSIEVGVKHVVSINRRGGGGGGGGGHGGGGGGGGGGHGGGGGGGGHGGEGNGGHGNNGDKSPFTGGAVIPLYAAGAAGGVHHRNDHQHHGANGATPLCCGLSYLVFIVFLSLVIFV